VSTSKTARRGGALAAILMGVALFGGVNYLASRHWKRGDWTRTKLYSLSETTEKMVRGLQKPVRVTVFMTPRSRLYTPVKELLARYRTLSSKIEIEELDPERNPVRAQAILNEVAGIREGTVVFRSGDKKKHVTEDQMAEMDFSGMQMGVPAEVKAFKGEEAFTSAIASVTENVIPKVYFTTGHGESSLDSGERGRGYAGVKQMLESDNMTVGTWASLGKSDLPPDVTAIVVAGPRAPFLEPERQALEDYLARGGRLLILLDPVIPVPGAPPADFGLGGLLAKHGLRADPDIVIDPANALPMVGAETVIANRYGSHPIVRSLASEGLAMLFPLARSFSKAEAPGGASPAMLIETSSEGWGETGLDRLESAVDKGPQDHAGPVTLAFAVGPAGAPPADPMSPAPVPAPVDDPKAPRLVVVGNSRFAADGFLDSGANANFLRNALHWLTGTEKKMGIAPKTPERASLSLTQSQVRRIALVTVLGMPLFAALVGAWVWYRRRD
jgi:ABC-type uncharacterized transport system involved in gliding motility auxiliary subunit